MPATARTQPAPLTGLTPEQLAVRAQLGSIEAYATLVSVFEERLFNFLLRRVVSEADAEDVAQDTFIRAWQRIHQYNPRWKFSTWLFTIGSRLASSRYRDKPAPPAALPADYPGAAPRAKDRLAQTEDRLRVWSLVEQLLSPEQHTALWLRYAEDLAIGDIARILGKTEVGVRVMLFRARNVLAARLTDESGQVEWKQPAASNRHVASPA